MALSKIDSSSVNGLGYGFKNRIINGDMRIDQRNAGASVSGQAFGVDRFCSFNQCDGAITSQQVSDAPEGFNYSYKITVTTADTSLGTAQYMELRQMIEGYNVADLGWGTASAKTVTLSFWTKSSLTGTFGGTLMNSSVNRSYPFSYTINAANTWEYKTITVPGDTTGTWEKTNGNGMFVMLNLGAGTDWQGTANAWVASRKQTVSGAVSLIGTLNATWQITGVQLEKGTVATEFDYRPYGAELQLCQRYYEVVATATEYLGCGFWNSATAPYVMAAYKVTKRAAPTMSYVGTVGNMTVFWSGSGLAFSSMTLTSGQGNTFYLYGVTSSGGTTGQAVGVSLGAGNQIVASAEL